jgi:hypothetical protein
MRCDTLASMQASVRLRPCWTSWVSEAFSQYYLDSQNNEAGTLMGERSTFVTPNTASDPVMAVKIDSLLLRLAYGS